jgi:hypothetical protein
VDTLLTLVIALGGIATGIGAIWTAMLARRQLSEQRRFLEEQNELARRQTQVSEQSFAQTERSLAEQNNRARLTLEYDLLTRAADRRETPYFLGRRREAARFLLDNAFSSPEKAGTRSLPHAAFIVCDGYEELGEMVRVGVLSAESVWSRFGAGARAWWILCQPAIEKMRQEWKDPALYEEFERLYRVIEEMDREQGISSPMPRAYIRQYLESEATLGEEHPRSYGDEGS